MPDTAARGDVARRPSQRRLHRPGSRARLAAPRPARPVRPAAADDLGPGTRSRSSSRSRPTRCSRCRCSHPDHRSGRRPAAALARGARDQQHAAGHRRRHLPGGAVQRVVPGHRDRRPQPRRRRPLRPAAGDRRALGLDTSSERTLWRDRALVEMVRAVQHSFDAAGVTMADHHTESRAVPRPRGPARRTPADAAPPTGAGSCRRCPVGSPPCSTATTTSPTRTTRPAFLPPP